MRTFLLVLFGLCCAGLAHANPADLCGTVGYSGKPQNVKSCSNGNNTRTIECVDGFVVAGSTSNKVTIPGRIAFKGCVAAPPVPCTAYGYSGKPENAESCENHGDSRKITCIKGFVVANTVDRFIRLAGDAAFAGCVAEKPQPSRITPRR